MRIIIDSNVLFSALIRNSKTRAFILEYDGLFLFPAYIFLEMQKHKKELLQKSGMGEKEISNLLEIILKKVMIVADEVLDSYKKEALKIVKDIDPDDVLFVACALAYPNGIVWSDDKKLKKQNRITVLSTTEVIELFKEGKND